MKCMFFMQFAQEMTPIYQLRYLQTQLLCLHCLLFQEQVEYFYYV